MITEGTNSSDATMGSSSRQVDDMFLNDLVAIEGLRFDNFLERAITDTSDEEAFAELTASFDRAKARGDFLHIQQMAMVLGAMACMHDHLQQFSNQMAQDYLGGSQEEHFGHIHKTSKDSKEEKDTWPFNGKKKSKNAKARSLFAIFFSIK